MQVFLSYLKLIKVIPLSCDLRIGFYKIGCRMHWLIELFVLQVCCLSKWRLAVALSFCFSKDILYLLFLSGNPFILENGFLACSLNFGLCWRLKGLWNWSFCSLQLAWAYVVIWHIVYKKLGICTKNVSLLWCDKRWIFFLKHTGKVLFNAQKPYFVDGCLTKMIEWITLDFFILFWGKKFVQVLGKICFILFQTI